MSTRTASFDDDAQTLRLEAQRESLPPTEEKVDPYLVSFGPDDPANPMNWSRLQRWWLTIAGGILVLNATFASSAPAGILEQVIIEYHMSQEVATLMISLFVAGYCVGPLVWGPLSEEFGRRPVFLVSFFVYTGFQVGMALSKNVASLLIFRFLGGTFAAAALTNSGAIISDIWDADTRGKALALFTVAPFAGPALGPTVAGYISVAGAGVCWLAILLGIPETYKPVILANKAKKLRKETGDDKYYAPKDREIKTMAQQIENVLARPFKMLAQEPMMMATTLYMSFVYGCLYLLFEAYPIVFTEGHGFNAGASGLMYLPVMLGGALAVILYLLIWNPLYAKEAARVAPAPVEPEYRLHMTCYAGPIFAASFFWFGWTSYSSISFWAPMMAGLGIGFAISWIFLGFFNYIIDTYLMVAASALAANTVCRSLFGAVFPLFATQMYQALNPRWASTLVGFVALLMVPMPFIFLKYGARLRMKSKYAPTKPLPTTKTTESASSAV